MAFVTVEDKRWIIHRYRDGRTIWQISEEMHLSYSTVFNVLVDALILKGIDRDVAMDRVQRGDTKRKRKRIKHTEDGIPSIEEINRKAMEHGLTYGQYMVSEFYRREF